VRRSERRRVPIPTFRTFAVARTCFRDLLSIVIVVDLTAKGNVEVNFAKSVFTQ
jgi:hypothetical protein